MARHPDYLFEARNPAQVLEAVTRYKGEPPTVAGLRTWVNTILGPWHIPAEVNARCRKG